MDGTIQTLHVRLDYVLIPCVIATGQLQDRGKLADFLLNLFERVVVAHTVSHMPYHRGCLGHELFTRTILARPRPVLVERPADPCSTRHHRVQAVSRADQDGNIHVAESVDHVAPLVDRGSDVDVGRLAVLRSYDSCESIGGHLVHASGTMLEYNRCIREVLRSFHWHVQAPPV